MGRRDAETGTILITGISASGKSILGKLLLDNLSKLGITNVRLLDGEEIRATLRNSGKDFGYTTEERNAFAMEIANTVEDSNDEGYVCIVCAIVHVRETRDKMRAQLGHFMEVFLDCPVEVCAERDRKGNYSKAFAGLYDNFIGVTEPYQGSERVELALDTNRKTVDECSAMLLRETLAFLRNSSSSIVARSSRRCTS